MSVDEKTVCLCMIVKDEAHVIRRCLASVRPLLDHWIVVDTGSSDGTQGIVRDAMAGLPGEVVERPWVDFAHNRSEALTLARPHAAYSLVIDADDELVLEPGYALPSLGDDSYSIDIHYGGTIYRRPQLVKNALVWRYRGVLHEFLECAEAKTQGHLPIVMKINHEGARSTDPSTYAKDAAVLERALRTETDPFLVARYTFYLAQSYRDCGEREKALVAYLKRAEQGYWAEEVFVSLLNAGRLTEALGRPPDEALALYRRAIETCPSRAEAAHDASRLCRLNNRFVEGYALAKAASELPRPGAGLFVEAWIYLYGVSDELAVNAYWAGRFRECLAACDHLLAGGAVPAHMIERVRQNRAFALEKIESGVTDIVPPVASADDGGTTACVFAKQFRIYRTIHVVWVGDESKRPDNCIDTWRRMNPDWDVVVWGNRELDREVWRNRRHIDEMLGLELAGVADMMRWEILEKHGGFAIDADAVCLRPLEHWLFEPELFAVWENEIAQPGLVANGYVYAHPRQALIRRIVEDIAQLSDMRGGRAWQLVGPQRLTDTIRGMGCTDITIYPSHYFIPEHLSGQTYSGRGPVFAKQLWGSSRTGLYDSLKNTSAAELARR